MEYRFAIDLDLDDLADWNHQLIQDEGHANPMSKMELRERMRCWLATEYAAVIFSVGDEPAGYALYKDGEKELYLRHFFILREKRRQGLGRAAMQLLREEIWPAHKRLTLEVLVNNTPALSFWRAMGYKDYCLKLEMVP
jgi:predicted acetyltransferase